MQMLVGLDCCGMISIFPERSAARLALVVFLRGTSSDQLHALGDNGRACVPHQEMNVVGYHHIVEQRKTKRVGNHWNLAKRWNYWNGWNVLNALSPTLNIEL